MADASMTTYASKAPVTGERRLNLDLQGQLPKPYLSRALVAADPSHPKGTPGRECGGLSVLQQHVSFFDRNKDGVVYPWETYRGFRAIGCGFFTSILSAFSINLGFSYFTQKGWLPSPLLPIHIKNIHKVKHGSDTQAYDTEGRFDPAKFDAIFSKYALTHPDALTRAELSNMLRANRNYADFMGWLSAAGEWGMLYSLAKDESGFLQRETIRGVYDGSLFEQLEKKRASASKKS